MKRVGLKLNRPQKIGLLSLVCLLILSWSSIGWLHPDEHFQILEFASWKLHITKPEQLAWEFHYRMRPTIQPAMVVGMHKLFGLFGSQNPFHITFSLRILSALFSFLSMWMIYNAYKNKIANERLRNWFLPLSFLLWFPLYYYVRFTSETWGGVLFVIGFSYLFLLKRKPIGIDFFLTGLVMGLSFVFRFQVGLLIAGYLAWFLIIRKERIKNLLMVVFGITLSIVVGVLIDRWFYGQWTISLWNYFQENLVSNKISGFGIMPWYYYFTNAFHRLIPPFSLIFLISITIVFVFLRKDLLTWTLLPFLLFHCFLGHKEERFLFPMFGFIPILVIKGFEELSNRSQWFNNIQQKWIFTAFVKTFWTFNMVCIFIEFFNPADRQVQMFEKIYDSPRDVKTLCVKGLGNPFGERLEMIYYKKQSLGIRQIDSIIDPFNAQKGRYLLLMRGGLISNGYHSRTVRKIYSTYPDWVMQFNVNHWVERTSINYLFEIDE